MKMYCTESEQVVFVNNSENPDMVNDSIVRNNTSVQANNMTVIKTRMMILMVQAASLDRLRFKNDVGKPDKWHVTS